jgi:hypothetical protein
MYPFEWIGGNTLEYSPHQLLFHKPCISARYLRQVLRQARIYSGIQLQLSPKKVSVPFPSMPDLHFYSSIGSFQSWRYVVCPENDRRIQSEIRPHLCKYVN